MTVALSSGGSKDIRIALPEHLILGIITMRDVTAKAGPPQHSSSFTAENSWFYTHTYYTGGEGSEHLDFTVVSDGKPLTASEVDDSLVTSCTASYGQ
jgi:hypothetical protein